MHLFPSEHGWLIAREESHAVLYLGMRGEWTDDMGDARVMPSKREAFDRARRFHDAAPVPLALAEWFRPPRIRVLNRPAAAR